MKITVEDIATCRKSMRVEVPEALITEHTDALYKNLMRKVRIPGFRPGKAPRQLLEQRYAKDIREEVLQDLIPKGYQEGIRQHHLSPVSHPNISDVSFDGKGPLSFKAAFDVFPDFELNDYLGLNVTKNVFVIDDDVRARALETFQDQYAQYIDVAEDRPVEKGDIVTCDYTCLVDDIIVEERKDVWLEPLAQRFDARIQDVVLGLRIGESKDLALVLAKDFYKPDLAEKDAILRITIKDLKIKQLQQLDDVFAKNLGLDNLEALHKEVENSLKKSAENEAMDELNMDLRDMLRKNHPMAVPQSVVEHLLEDLVVYFKRHVASQGSPQEYTEEQEAKIKDRLRPQAQNRAQEQFILLKIADKENITVDKAAIDARLHALAHHYNKKLSELSQNQNLLYNVEEELLLAKAMDFIIDKANITEKAIHKKLGAGSLG